MVGVAGLLSTGSAGATDFTCGGNSACYFATDSFTGATTSYSGIQVLANTDVWTLIPQGTRGALTDNNNQNIQVFAADTGGHQTVFGGTKAVLNDTFGWWCSGTWAICDQGLPEVRHAIATAARTSCASGTTCVFGSTGFGGTENDYTNSASGGSWLSLPSGVRASVIEGGASDVWFFNKAGQLGTCVQSSSQDSNLSFPGGLGDPGYMFVQYGVTTPCADESVPAGAPS